MAGDHSAPVVNERLVREHTEVWHAFTRFTTVGIISVILVLLMFLLQFFIGWGYAVLFMVLGFVVTAIAAALGKI